MGVPLWVWIAFHGVVLAALGLDLAFAGAGGRRRAAIWTAVWVTLALAMGVWLLKTRGPQPAVSFITCYLLELSLSVDNLVVMLFIFTSRNVSEPDQRRMLLWGVLGAVIMRGAFILTGSLLLDRLDWVSYVFAAILIWAGIRMGIGRQHKAPAKAFPGLSPFLSTLLLIETADLIFAVDSVPAAFAVTRDPFLIYTANILAVIGLRSLYVLLASATQKVVYLDKGLAVILVFVGLTIALESVIEVPPGATLLFVIATLVVTTAISARKFRQRNV